MGTELMAKAELPPLPVPPPLGEQSSLEAVEITSQSWSGFPTSDEDELLGKTLNETYVVESVLGEGGMGRVYRASHTRITQKRFAIKVLRPEFARDPEVLARFRREAEAAACIAHPNVVGVYDVDRTKDGLPYLVCEYLDGIDLSAHLKNTGPMQTATAAHVAVQVCAALEAAHARTVIHRDLKPHNVFLLGAPDDVDYTRPTIKVLDFGLSRFAGASDTQLTRTGVIMGTPAFMAPEQARGLRVDKRVDVYGIGAILYTALTGRPPFDEETPQLTVLAVMGRDPPRPRSLNAIIPESLELIIQRAMAKEPDERYQDVSELRLALEPFDAFDAHVGPDPRRNSGAGSGRRGSRVLFEAEAHEVSSARLRLVGFVLLSMIVLAAGLATAATGIELLTGKIKLTQTELALLLFAILGTALTPMLLLLRRIRRTIWGNSAKVLDLLVRIRGSLLIGVAAYGFSALAVRFSDDVVARFGWQSLLGHGAGINWPGWNLLLLLIGLITAATALLQQRWQRLDLGRFRRFLAGPFTFTVACLCCLQILYWGLHFRKGFQVDHAASVAAAVAEPASRGEKAKAKPKPVSAPNVAPAPNRKPEPIKRASDNELAEAMTKGVEGLLPLSERYPSDPAVLKPLMFTFASRATTLADAMMVAKRLFAVAPEETRDPDIRYLVRKAAQTPGQASKLAFDLLAENMGSSGPDLLYELMLTSPKAKERAQELLEDPKVRQQFSPALSVAYELRTADSCAARLPFLTRAAQLGDERSVAVLSPLSTGTKRGCGRWKRSPCKARCAEEASEYLKAIKSITSRLRATRR